MILSDVQIKNRITLGDLTFDPPIDLKEQLQPASVDLRLGNEFQVSDYGSSVSVNTRNPHKITKSVIISTGDYFILHPGEFCLAQTLEYVKVPGKIQRRSYQTARYPERMGNREKKTEYITYPCLTGRVEGRSSIARLGVLIHTCAGFIDPGFEGHITLELCNLSALPVYLWPGDRVCQIAFYETGEVERPYGSDNLNSKYQGQIGSVPSRGIV